jgi:hypothetical protein
VHWPYTCDTSLDAHWRQLQQIWTQQSTKMSKKLKNLKNSLKKKTFLSRTSRNTSKVNQFITIKLRRFWHHCDFCSIVRLSITSTTIRGFWEFFCLKRWNSENPRIEVLVMDSLSIVEKWSNRDDRFAYRQTQTDRHTHTRTPKFLLLYRVQGSRYFGILMRAEVILLKSIQFVVLNYPTIKKKLKNSKIFFQSLHTERTQNLVN